MVLAVINLQYQFFNCFFRGIFCSNEIEYVFDELKGLSIDISKNTKLNSSEVRVIKILIDYEALIAETNIRLDTKLFSQINQKLTSEWKTLKKKYSMEEQV